MLCAGDERFLEAEGQAVLQLRKQDTIISLTGSVPLHPTALEHLAKDGVLVYLDVEPVCCCCCSLSGCLLFDVLYCVHTGGDTAAVQPNESGQNHRPGVHCALFVVVLFIHCVL